MRIPGVRAPGVPGPSGGWEALDMGVGSVRYGGGRRYLGGWEAIAASDPKVATPFLVGAQLSQM
jgi:hypothetical protein